MKDMDALQGSRTCTVLDLPEDIHAGAELRFGVEVAAEPSADLAGLEVELVDGTGDVVARADFALAEDGDASRYVAPDIALTAPQAPGPHRFVARLAAFKADGVSYPPVEAEVQLQVLAHRVAPVVWDVPEAVTPGATFTVMVGARCASDCDASGWRITVRDPSGRIKAEAATGPEPWTGTSGLHYAEVMLTAPDGIGLETWEVTVGAPDAALHHEEGRRTFGVRTTPPADATLRIEAVEAGTDTPAAGVKVVCHPFSALTGADGTVEIAVPSGAHRVFVSGARFIPCRVVCTIEENETLRVELEPDTGLTDAMKWG